MRHDHRRAAEFSNDPLKKFDVYQIKVIGWFVQQQRVRIRPGK
jgi:hypothetical protein